MAKSREQKEALLAQYKEMLESSGGYFAVDTTGLSTTAATELKLKLKELDSNLYVVKNRVFQIALREADQPTEAIDFNNQTAVVTYSEDPTEIAKLIKEVQKDTEVMEAKYGLIDGDFMDGERAMQLADIPSREVLLAKMLGSMTAPLTGVARMMNGNVTGFTRILQQLSSR